MKKAQRYEVKVWFAPSSAPRVVAVFADLEAALREARAYLNADARGVWVNNVEVK